MLPKSLRNEDSGDFPLFKNHLDIFLAMVPDQPTTSGLARPAASNSLLDQVVLVKDLDLDTFEVLWPFVFCFVMFLFTWQIIGQTTIVETAVSVIKNVEI